MRPLPVALALLLVLAPVGAVAVPGAIVAADSPPTRSAITDGRTPGDGTPAQFATNDSAQADDRRLRVLDIPSEGLTRSGIDTVTLDVGPSVRFDTRTTTSRIGTRAMVERVEGAETQDRRKQILLGELNRIEQQVIGLQSDQTAAFRAYAAGDLDGRELLFTLAVVGTEAEELERRRERLAALSQETADFSLDQGRLASVERELATFTGPVREYSVDVLRGEAPPSRFYIATSDTGVVLTAVRNDRWVREVYRGDRRNRGGGSIDPSTALNVTQRSYPQIWATKRNSTEVVGSGESFLVRISHSSGSLSAYVDSGTQEVFKETQSRPLSTLGTGERISERKDGLRLTVNRTYPGAPLRIRLTSAATGEPLDANITVGREGEDSVLVGRTGDDGILWSLTPRGRVTVTAIRGNAAIIVRFDPAPIPRVQNDTTNTTAAVDPTGTAS